MYKFAIIFLLGFLISFALPKSTEQDQEPETTVTVQEANETSPVKLVSKPLKIKNLKLNDRIVYLNSEVTTESVDLAINLIGKYNEQNSENIYMLVNSPGGSVIDGSRLITTMEGSTAKVIAINTGLCASMCFMILEHASKRLGIPRATLMAHGASLGVSYQGKLDEIVSRLTYMQSFVDKMDMYVAKRAGISYEKFKSLSQRELWIDSEDALQMHLLDEVVSINVPAVTDVFPNSGSELYKKKFNLE